jgi:hypothetical protein
MSAPGGTFIVVESLEVAVDQNRILAFDGRVLEVFGGSAGTSKMCAEQGADKITMDGLAERAGLGKGTVFRRFGTRAGIFQALLDDDERDFQQRVLNGPGPQTGPDPHVLFRQKYCKSR